MRRVLLIALHLAIPAVLVVWLATAGEALLSSDTPVWKNLRDGGWRKLEDGLESRKVRFDWIGAAGTVPAQSVDILAVRVCTARFGLEAAFQPADGGKKLSELAKEQDCPVACNGGYFGMKGEPVTLLISRGKELAAASEKLPWSGVYWLQPNGRASAGTLKGYRGSDGKPDFALQNSPLLVIDGNVCWPPIKKESTAQKEASDAPQRFLRTAAGVDGQGLTVLAVCRTPISLEEWAIILRANDRIGGLGLRDAVNLDGGPSSGLAICHDKLSDAVEAGRPLPYYLLVRRRPEPLPKEKPATESEGDKPEGAYIRPE